MEEIQLKDLLIILKKYWYYVFYSLVAALIIGCIYTFLIVTPVYQSSFSIYETNAQLINDYKVLVINDTILSEVVNQLKGENINISSSELSANIAASVNAQSKIVTVTVKDTNPQRVQLIAASISQALSDYTKEKITARGINIVSTPRVPTKPISPNVKTYLMLSLFFGIIIGFGIIFIKEYFKTKIEIPEDVKRMTGLPVVGVLPSLDIDYLSAYTEPKSFISKTIRTLRTNIQLFCSKEQIKTLVVTSSCHGEGKSTTITNLAVAFTQAGNKVLLIDADYKEPLIYKIFNLKNNSGLGNILANDISLKDVVQKTEINDLDVITSGDLSLYPSDMLSSKKMKEFISQVRNEYDIVLIDTAPLNLALDAAIISSMVDGAIVIAGSKEINAGKLNKTKELLSKANANIIGVVLNKLDKNSLSTDYSSEYYCYDSSEIIDKNAKLSLGILEKLKTFNKKESKFNLVSK